MTRFYIETYGCQMNSYDSQVMTRILEESGLKSVTGPEDADLIIFNTCSVRDKAEQRVLGRINQLDGLRREGDRQLMMGVAGCMSQRLERELLKVTRGRIDFVVGPDQYQRLPEIVTAAGTRHEDLVFTDFDHVVTYQAKPKVAPPGGTHFVAVMRGCDKFCSYCIVPYTRGRERSRDWREIVTEIEELAAGGACEVTLLGQTVSSYSHDGLDFVGLLGRIHQVEGIRSIRFMTSYPTDLNLEFFRALKELPKVGRGIHLPFQSGSDRILGAMNRRYTIAEYEAILETGKGELDDLLFSTDIIVGYPGETEADFQATLDVLERQKFISAFMFKYSPRAGTLSARQGDDVPQEVKEERLARLIVLQDRCTATHLQGMVGREMEILLDEPSKKDDTKIRGRTRNNIRVIVDREPEHTIGSMIRVNVRQVKGTSLLADPVS